MTTSGSIDFTVTADEIITEALELLGVLGEGEDPTTDQLTSSRRTLNMLAKTWQAEGLNLFAVTDYTFDLVQGQSVYRLDGATVLESGEITYVPRPMTVIEAYYREGTNPEIPCKVLSRLEYNELSVKETEGVATQVYFDPQVGYAELSVWPTATATAGQTIRIVVQRTLEDFDTGSNTPDFPQEWYMPLSFNLARALAPKYGTPQMDYARIMQQARELYETVREFDTELHTSVYLRPNTWGNGWS